MGEGGWRWGGMVNYGKIQTGERFEGSPVQFEFANHVAANKALWNLLLLLL
jgi:hypothetical protein